MVTAPATARGRHDLTSSERRNQKSAPRRGQTVLAVAVPRTEKVAFVMHLSRMVLQFGGRQASIIPFGGSEGAKQSKKRRASESEVTFSAADRPDFAGKTESSDLLPAPPVWYFTVPTELRGQGQGWGSLAFGRPSAG